MENSIDFNALKEPFDPSLISWRVGAMTKDKSKGIALAYIDARDVMDRLDDVCGVGGWQIKYSHANGKTIADIGIKIDGEWIWKANGAGDTQVEAEKGAISDAMKRAAVVWGIGRYLYDVQNIWVDLDDWKKIKNPKDSRLVSALEKAAKGIRVCGETPNAGKPEPTPEQKKVIAYIEKVRAEIRAAPDPADIGAVIHLHLKEIRALKPEQSKYIYDCAAFERKKFEQPMAAE